ncbi:hypothetical protein F7725_003816 [Dissostichus mawsoni]|uniref:Uncharacterized protein n=1 Tax=Dissostichus mawsoni TaxID=36200 RepID=A0A7J5YEL3_DISMA|nr:hypothetical protein F7725_003816 [Dissostichus mawsoni]
MEPRVGRLRAVVPQHSAWKKEKRNELSRCRSEPPLHPSRPRAVPQLSARVSARDEQDGLVRASCPVQNQGAVRLQDATEVQEILRIIWTQRVGWDNKTTTWVLEEAEGPSLSACASISEASLSLRSSNSVWVKPGVTSPEEQRSQHMAYQC